MRATLSPKVANSSMQVSAIGPPHFSYSLTAPLRICQDTPSFNLTIIIGWSSTGELSMKAAWLPPTTGGSTEPMRVPGQLRRRRVFTA